MNINNYLNLDEKIIRQAQVSKIPVCLPLIISGICAILGIIGIITTNTWLKFMGFFSAIVILIYAFSIFEYCFSTKAFITNKRVLMYTGWLNRKISELPLEKVSGASFEQSPFGRIFNYSTTIIESSANVSGVRIKWLKDAFEFKKFIQDQLEQTN